MALDSLPLALGFCLLIVHFVKQTYTFQIKEYRFDRLFAHLADIGLIPFLYGFDIRVPAIKKPRNIAILLFCCVVAAFISRLIPDRVLYSVLLIALSPILALIVCSIAVFITSIPVAIYRKFIINKAKQTLSIHHPIVIGITGSYGKSTTKEYLSHILTQKYQVAKTDRNQNTDIGVAMSVISNIKPSTEYFIAEMGAYKVNEIKTICNFVYPQIGIITGIGTQHLALFGSKEELFYAKSELGMALPPEGMLFIASSLDKIQKLRLKKLVKCPIFEYEAVVNDPHQSAINASIAVARHLKIPHEAIQTTISHMVKPIHLKPRLHTSGYSIIDSSYSTNANAFVAHIQILKTVHKSKKIILTSGIIELGKEKENIYKEILNALPAHTMLYTSDKTFQKVASPSQAKVVIYNSNQHRLIDIVKKSLSSDVAILIEGRFRSDILSDIIY